MPMGVNQEARDTGGNYGETKRKKPGRVAADRSHKKNRWIRKNRQEGRKALPQQGSGPKGSGIDLLEDGAETQEMNKILATINGVRIFYRVSDTGDEMIRFKGCMTIDADGSGSNPDHDPAFQPETFYQPNGRSLNADEESFIVVPPIIPQKTKGIVFGSLCYVENTKSGKSCFAVVGDLSDMRPSRRLGEASPACARQISVNPNARTGGEDNDIIRYTIFVGSPARIHGHLYPLQPYG